MIKQVNENTYKVVFNENNEIASIPDHIENLMLQEMILEDFALLHRFYALKKLLIWNCDIAYPQSLQNLPSIEMVEFGTGNDIIALDSLLLKEIQIHRSANTKEIYLSNMPYLEKISIYDYTRKIHLTNLPSLQLVVASEINRITECIATQVSPDCQYRLYNFQGLVINQ